MPTAHDGEDRRQGRDRRAAASRGAAAARLQGWGVDASLLAASTNGDVSLAFDQHVLVVVARLDTNFAPMRERVHCRLNRCELGLAGTVADRAGAAATAAGGRRYWRPKRAAIACGRSGRETEGHDREFGIMMRHAAGRCVLELLDRPVGRASGKVPVVHRLHGPGCEREAK